MLFALYVLWIILNGRTTVDVLVSGVFVIAIVGLFCYKNMGYRIQNEKIALKKAGKLFCYFLLLLKEMIIANVQVLSLVLSPTMKIRPCIIRFQPRINSIPGRVLLANCITLVPGSVTIEMMNEGYIVHAMTTEIAQSVRESSFERMIREIEDEG